MVLLRHLEQGMRPISRYYNPIACSNTLGSFFSGLPSTETTNNKLLYRSSAMKQKSKAETKEIAAKKHSEAERRRRLRINCQYATLRTILPNLVKDKASVLSETVRYFNELKRTVKDIEAAAPALVNNIKLSYCNKHGERGLAKVVFSCSDKAELMSKLSQLVASAKGKVVRAEIMTVGGRTKCAFYVEGLEGNEGLGRLKKALKTLVNGNASTSSNHRRTSLLSH